MNFLRAVLAELFSLFVDDGALAAQVLVLVLATGLAVTLLGLPALAGAVLVLTGCLVILAVSLRRAGRK